MSCGCDDEHPVLSDPDDESDDVADPLHELHPSSAAFREHWMRCGRCTAASRTTTAARMTRLANIRNGAEFVGIEPWRAAMVRLSDKVTRLATFNRTGELHHEAVEDSLLDLASYACSPSSSDGRMLPMTEDDCVRAEHRARRFQGAWTGTAGTLAADVCGCLAERAAAATRAGSQELIRAVSRARKLSLSLTLLLACPAFPVRLPLMAGRAKRLQVLEQVCAALCLWRDVIDVSRLAMHDMPAAAALIAITHESLAAGQHPASAAIPSSVC
jgi:hypothetical protein